MAFSALTLPFTFPAGTRSTTVTISKGCAHISPSNSASLSSLSRSLLFLSLSQSLSLSLSLPFALSLSVFLSHELHITLVHTRTLAAALVFGAASTSDPYFMNIAISGAVTVVVTPAGQLCLSVSLSLSLSLCVCVYIYTHSAVVILSPQSAQCFLMLACPRRLRVAQAVRNRCFFAVYRSHAHTHTRTHALTHTLSNNAAADVALSPVYRESGDAIVQSDGKTILFQTPGLYLFVANVASSGAAMTAQFRLNSSVNTYTSFSTATQVDTTTGTRSDALPYGSLFFCSLFSFSLAVSALFLFLFLSRSFCALLESLIFRLHPTCK